MSNTVSACDKIPTLRHRPINAAHIPCGINTQMLTNATHVLPTASKTYLFISFFPLNAAGD